jgi:hypothetical protein
MVRESGNLHGTRLHSLLQKKDLDGCRNCVCFAFGVRFTIGK